MSLLSSNHPDWNNVPISEQLSSFKVSKEDDGILIKVKEFKTLKKEVEEATDGSTTLVRFHDGNMTSSVWSNDSHEVPTDDQVIERIKVLLKKQLIDLVAKRMCESQSGVNTIEAFLKRSKDPVFNAGNNAGLVRSLGEEITSLHRHSAQVSQRLIQFELFYLEKMAQLGITSYSNNGVGAWEDVVSENLDRLQKALDRKMLIHPNDDSTFNEDNFTLPELLEQDS